MVQWTDHKSLSRFIRYSMQGTLLALVEAVSVRSIDATTLGALS